MASTRGEVVKVRFTKEERAHVEKGQSRMGYATLSSYIRDMALNARPNPDRDLDAEALAERLGEIGFLINRLDLKSTYDVSLIHQSFNALRQEIHLRETARRCGHSSQATLVRKPR